jgi:hypothetical protein
MSFSDNAFTDGVDLVCENFDVPECNFSNFLESCPFVCCCDDLLYYNGFIISSCGVDIVKASFNNGVLKLITKNDCFLVINNSYSVNGFTKVIFSESLRIESTMFVGRNLISITDSDHRVSCWPFEILDSEVKNSFIYDACVYSSDLVDVYIQIGIIRDAVVKSSLFLDGYVDNSNVCCVEIESGGFEDVTTVRNVTGHSFDVKNANEIDTFEIIDSEISDINVIKRSGCFCFSGSFDNVSLIDRYVVSSSNRWSGIGCLMCSYLTYKLIVDTDQPDSILSELRKNGQLVPFVSD